MLSDLGNVFFKRQEAGGIMLAAWDINAQVNAPHPTPEDFWKRFFQNVERRWRKNCAHYKGIGDIFINQMSARVSAAPVKVV